MEIFLIDDVDEVLEQPAAKVVCQRTFREGEEEPLRLSLWGTVGLVHPFATIVAEMCKAFDCCCLIDDGTVNPYLWIHCDGEGKTRLITYCGP